MRTIPDTRRNAALRHAAAESAAKAGAPATRPNTALRHLAITALAVTLLIIGGFCLPQTARAASDFYIENYNVDVQVNEDDTYLIKETVDVHFTAPSHGIYRTIPIKTRLDRDGQISEFYIKVKGFEMLSDQPCSKDKGDDAYYFKIGDPDKYADEDTTYEFSYVLDPRGDRLEGADEFYYNLVGTTWEAQSIEHVTAAVTFPKPIDMNNVGVKTGYEVNVPFKAEGDRVVTIDTTEDCITGLTVRAVLPQGYFTRQAGTSNLLFYILIAIIAAATAWGFLMWRKYGRDPQIVETEEFYPPEGLTAPEVAYLENGEIDGKKITSMLLTLADKGYLTISEKEVPYGLKKQKTKTEYVITQVKAYDGDSPDEKEFMRGLFDFGGRPTVEMSDLKNSFYETVNEIRKNIMERFEGQLYDEKAESWATNLRIVGGAGMIALFIISKALNGSPFIVGNGDFIIYIVLAVLQVVLPLAAFHGIAAWINKPRRSVAGFILGFIGWVLLALLGFGLAVLFDTCMGPQILPYFIGMVMIFLLFLMAALCERKTDNYAELLGKIRGYKRFLQVAEKDRMEMLAEQDPNYFYKNLAFAFALGVTAVYAKHFAALAKEPPHWYYSPYYTAGSAFNSVNMMNSMDSMMSSVSTTMTSSPSGSGGGGSFSGGGGVGGGGGGSW